MSDPAALSRAIEAARGDPALGRSTLVRRLFDYLAESSLAGRSPKESEVAIEVFGRQPDFDPSRDAVARVYVHKLRRRLEAIGDGQGLTIPRGEYRLALREKAPPVRRPQWLRRAGLAVAAVALASLCAVGAWTIMAANAGSSAPARLADVQPWKAVTGNGKPTIVAIGDYYIFADMGPGGGPGRLVREYTVNSPEDLNQFARDNPERSAGYRDLGLHYLPVGSASAVMNVTLALQGARDLRVLPVSSLTPAMLRDSNIVYVGYLSGLGLLRDATFAGSRYSIGETYDDIVDNRTRQRFESGGGAPHRGDAMYPDYGYLATFAGPTGNRFVIVAGTRDAALMQMGQNAVSRGVLDDLARAGGKAGAAEALYGINGMGEVNVDSRLIRAGPLDQAIIWERGAAGKPFPAG
ncbi:MAG: helix-turn-helix domain-containing protein [Sphingomonas sp.]|uniref:helix-turn-helix domain-containing protein n=1 Tax=Sphingomonas sp. TaxID=28214 RepID=UPI0022753EF8|nr:helix-turn-helix domain-containing protein [Sphingomonas sp.]MCX8476319.1 helix-turn-helix domain-containing protein [Sphingomonas sp.]